MEGLGYGCADNGLIFALNASLWTVSVPLVKHGTEEQKRRFLPGLCDGSLLGANAASEVDAGSEVRLARRRNSRSSRRSSVTTRCISSISVRVGM